MGIQELKAKAYELAGVNSTPQLKAKYHRIGQLNLRRKAAWQEAIKFLTASPLPDEATTHATHELKAMVYQVAQVSGTRQLKTSYEYLRHLNFSFKSSWKTALDLLQNNQADFEAWRENPTEEYRELFADIEATLQAFGKSIVKATALGKDAKKMAERLEELGQEAKAEAEYLREGAETQIRVARNAELN